MDRQTPDRPGLALQHRELIRACLAEPSELQAAVDDVFDRVEPDGFDYAAQQLFGFLHRRLVDLDIDHPVKPALGRVYKRTWYQNQLLIFRARPLFAHLEDLGGRPLVLKGGAMVSSAYHDDLGVRPFMDLDVLVDREVAESLVEWAQANGWRVSKGLDTRDVYIVHHAIDLEDGEGGAVDLHWALLVQGRNADRERRLIATGEPATLGGLPIEVLPPTFQLFHTAAHAKPEGVRHLIDVVSIVRRHGATIDWSCLVDEVLQRRTITYVTQTFDLVEEVEPGTIPTDVLQRLSEARRHWSDFAFHGEEINSRREALRRLAADVSGRARGEGPRQKARVARAMVRRFAQSNGLTSRELLGGFVSRGPGGLSTDDH